VLSMNKIQFNYLQTLQVIREFRLHALRLTSSPYEIEQLNFTEVFFYFRGLDDSRRIHTITIRSFMSPLQFVEMSLSDT